MISPADIRVNSAFEQGFQLGELRVEPPVGEVTGPGGCEKLDPKVMDVLVMLAQHAGHVVLRDDLIARVWPNSVVTDDSLSRCIYELRRQLSQAGANEQLKELIQTVPKRGYRLNSKITLLHSPAGERSRSLARRLLPALVIAVALAALLWATVGRQVAGPPEEPQPTAIAIAVLPFLDMSADQDQAYLADGISEEILNRLTQAGNLRVISRTSSFSFRGKPLDIRDIAAKLDVRYVLEGSVRKSSDDIRITAQLIAAADNSHLWSETFDRKSGDLFAVQDEIAASVATALQVTLAGGTPHSRMPATVEAYDRYLQGQFFYHRRAPGDIERSARYYESAVAADPGYARAWAALSGAYSLLRLDDQQHYEELLEKQGEAARRAVELDPRLAVAHARLARFHYATNDPKTGEMHLRQAATLDPNDLLVLGDAASDAMKRGDLDAAIVNWRRSVAQDPLSPVHRTNLAVTLSANGQLDEALTEFRRVLELSPDFGLDENIDVVRTLVLLRRYDEAQSELVRIPAGKYRDHGLALLHELSDRRAEADAALERLAARPGDTEDIVRTADIFAFRGMHDQAFAILKDWKETLADDKNIGRQRTWHFLAELRLSPFLKPLHADPRWAALMTEPT